MVNPKAAMRINSCARACHARFGGRSARGVRFKKGSMSCAWRSVVFPPIWVDRSVNDGLDGVEDLGTAGGRMSMIFFMSDENLSYSKSR